MSAASGDDSDHDDLAALFSGAEEAVDVDERRLLDAMHGDAPGAHDHDSPVWDTDESSGDIAHTDAETAFTGEPIDLSAIRGRGVEAGEESAASVGPNPFTATNPAGTVWVSAVFGGATRGVNLAATVVTMTESQLAEEICNLADRARLNAQSAS